MADIRAYIGASGSGKTLMAAVEAKREYYKGNRIYSNFHLNLDGKEIDFETRRKNEDLNYTPIFNPEDLAKISSGSSIFIDELDTLGVENPEERGVDSYSYRNESSTMAERFLKKKLRKKHCKIRYTIQQLGMTPTRIRDETLIVYEPYVYQSGINGAGELVPYIVHYRERKLDNITGEHKLTPDIRILVHPVFGYPSTPHPVYGVIRYVTPDMLKLYDTSADPFRPSDAKRVFGMKGEIISDGEDPIFPNEKAIYEALKKALPEASVILYPKSGHNCRRAGDMEISFPTDYGIPTIIIEVKGVDKYDKNDNVRMIKTSTHDGNNNYKGMNWGDALAFDANYGTIHTCMFRNPKNGDIFVFGIKDNFDYISGKQKVTISKLMGVQTLKDFSKSLKQGRVKVTAGDSILKQAPHARKVA